jgi:putative transposase
MPQSLAYNYSHIIFSTKYRFPFIDETIANELFNYIGGICKDLDFNPIKIGGHKDHIHILCVLSRKSTLMKLIEEIKTHSSKWMKTKGEKYQDFYWQRGYGSFSVTPSKIDIVVNYIENQAYHHQFKSFQEEYLAYLKKYNVKHDERFLWD